jgi:hypothetical protein
MTRELEEKQRLRRTFGLHVGSAPLSKSWPVTRD